MATGTDTKEANVYSTANTIIVVVYVYPLWTIYEKNIQIRKL